MEDQHLPLWVADRLLEEPSTPGGGKLWLTCHVATAVTATRHCPTLAVPRMLRARGTRMKLRPFGALPPFRALSPGDWLCCDLHALTSPASEEFNQKEYVWPYIGQEGEGGAWGSLPQNTLPGFEELAAALAEPALCLWHRLYWPNALGTSTMLIKFFQARI